MKKPPAVSSRAGALSTSNSSNSKGAVLFDPTFPAQVAPFQLLAIFEARASARAVLVAEGVLDLQDAVDDLQRDAVDQGLVRRFGQDAVQAVLASSFRLGGRRWI
jgi:hypothetical protein